MSCEGLSRRELLRRSGLLGGAALAFPEILAGEAAAAAPAPPPVAAPAGVGLRVGPDIYQSIGVRPLINARGTYTVLSGSTMLPEVRAAMAAASQHYVQMDELAEAIGARLATITGAEWGLTNGCSAALTHATAAAWPAATPTSTSASRTSTVSPRTKSSSPNTRGTSTTRPCAASACA
jgi:L-seryl-tRNA(Ser) seleniumtransferase